MGSTSQPIDAIYSYFGAKVTSDFLERRIDYSRNLLLSLTPFL
jgi:hypothetical protein